MKIVIDARMMSPRWTGIGLYSRKLIENLQLVDQSNQYVILVDQEQYKLWQPTAANFTKMLVPYKVYGFAEQLLMPSFLRKLKPDLVHFLHFNASIFYTGRRVVTIHDTTLLDFNVSPGGLVANIKYGLKKAAMRQAFHTATRANAIITPSAATKANLIKHYGDDIAQKIYITHEAVDTVKDLKAHSVATRPPRLLYVGNFYPYKNIGLIIQTLPKILKTHPATQLTLVGDTPRFKDKLRTLAKDLGVEAHVSFPGFVSDQRLAEAYTQASLFVFPSLSEGFGLPPLEAMAAGVPVVAAQASCLPEVLGEGARYFDPHDAGELADTINQLLANPKELAAMQKRGYTQLKPYSWRKLAEQTLAVYNLARPT